MNGLSAQLIGLTFEQSGAAQEVPLTEDLLRRLREAGL